MKLIYNIQVPLEGLPNCVREKEYGDKKSEVFKKVIGNLQR